MNLVPLNYVDKYGINVFRPVQDSSEEESTDDEDQKSEEED